MFGIIEKLKRRHLSKRPVKTRQMVSFVNWGMAKTGVLFVATDDIPSEYISCLVSFLRKHVALDVVHYVASVKRIPQEKGEREYYLTPKGVSFSGKLKEEALQKILGKGYDLLVDISVKPDGIYDYLVGQVDVRCKIGRTRTGGVYDVEFSDVRSAEDWKERLEYLLKE